MKIFLDRPETKNMNEEDKFASMLMALFEDVQMEACFNNSQ